MRALINLGAARPERRAALKLLCSSTHNGNTPVLARLGQFRRARKKREKPVARTPHTNKEVTLWICRKSKPYSRPRNKSRLASQLAGLLTDLISGSTNSGLGRQPLPAFRNLSYCVI